MSGTGSCKYASTRSLAVTTACGAAPALIKTRSAPKSSSLIAKSLSAFDAKAAGASAAINVYTAGKPSILRRNRGLFLSAWGSLKFQPVTKAQSDAMSSSLLRSSASRHLIDAVDL